MTNDENEERDIKVGMGVMELVHHCQIHQIKFGNAGQLLTMVVGCTADWKWKKSSSNNSNSKREGINYKNNIETIIIDMEMDITIIITMAMVTSGRTHTSSNQ